MANDKTKETITEVETEESTNPTPIIQTDEAKEQPLSEEDIIAASDEDEDLDSEDSLTFSNGVIEKIVAIAMHDVPGVVGMKGGWLNRIQDAFGATDARKGVTVDVTPESSVRVNIAIFIEYGSYAPQVFEDVKKAVVKRVSGMTGLEVAGVNLRIEDVLTAEEIARRAKRNTPALEEGELLEEPELLEAPQDDQDE